MFEIHGLDGTIFRDRTNEDEILKQEAEKLFDNKKFWSGNDRIPYELYSAVG